MPIALSIFALLNVLSICANAMFAIFRVQFFLLLPCLTLKIWLAKSKSLILSLFLENCYKIGKSSHLLSLSDWIYVSFLVRSFLLEIPSSFILYTRNLILWEPICTKDTSHSCYNSCLQCWSWVRSSRKTGEMFLWINCTRKEQWNDGRWICFARIKNLSVWFPWFFIDLLTLEFYF